MKIDGNKPAFPSGERWISVDLSGNQTENSKSPFHHGMSIRAYFAAQAMAALLSTDNKPINQLWEEKYYEKVAQNAILTADALLAELNKES